MLIESFSLFSICGGVVCCGTGGWRADGGQMAGAIIGVDGQTEKELKGTSHHDVCVNLICMHY